MTFKQFLNEKNEDISSIIKSLILDYKERGIEIINEGECMSFAEYLSRILDEYGIRYEILSDGMFYDVFDDTPKNLLYSTDEYGKTPVNFEQVGLPSHYWIYCNGKHYDSDTPNGVNDMFELPIIKNFYLKNK